MRCLISVSLLMLLLASCAPRQTPEQAAFLQELADRPVTCSGGADCDAKWGRAVEWVNNHTQTGIRQVNDWVITSNVVSDGAVPVTHYTEFSVVRHKTGRGGYRMEFKSYCDFGLSCNPSATQLRADFVTFVMGPPPGVTLSNGGMRATKTVSARQ